MSKLQVLSFMYVPNCRRCPFFQKLTDGVLNLSKILQVMSFKPNPVRFFC
ncbi:hypothetical protein Hanom_Chr11g01020021 [Helianthus anomalus]